MSNVALYDVRNLPSSHLAVAYFLASSGKFGDGTILRQVDEVGSRAQLNNALNNLQKKGVIRQLTDKSWAINMGYKSSVQEACVFTYTHIETHSRLADVFNLDLSQICELEKAGVFIKSKDGFNLFDSIKRFSAHMQSLVSNQVAA